MWAHFPTQRLVIEPTKFLDILVECVVQCTFYKFFTDYPSPPLWDVTVALLCTLRAVTFYRPETQTNKVKLTLATSSLLSDFCHENEKNEKTQTKIAN